MSVVIVAAIALCVASFVGLVSWATRPSPVSTGTGRTCSICERTVYLAMAEHKAECARRQAS